MATLSKIQLAYLIAGRSGAALQTVEKFLRGEPVRGESLRIRLQDAKTWAEQNGAAPAPPSAA